MGQTLTEKILSRIAGRSVAAGDFLELSPDWTFSLDDGIGLVDRYLRENGVEKLIAPEKIAIFYDHYSPADTPLHAHIHRLGRKLVERFGIPRLYDVGEGISHQVAIETGLVKPGQMVVNTDSHTTTIGAIGAIGSGIGCAEMAYLWAFGELWFRVPSSIRVTLTGRLTHGVTPKDIVLKALQELTARGGTYAAVEYHGDALANLGIPDRMTLCNMGVEMGGKFATVPADAVTLAHYRDLGLDPGPVVQPDADATYVREVKVDVGRLEPMVSAPSRADNVHAISSLERPRINQAFLGTCTNGRFEDLKQAADLLRGKRIASGVRMIVTPASRRVYQKALREGVVETLVEAGCTVTTPGCGACAGIHQGVLAEDEVCVATSSRNFIGRMGNRDAKIFLGSPLTVAASALEGRLADPRQH